MTALPDTAVVLAQTGTTPSPVPVPAPVDLSAALAAAVDYRNQALVSANNAAEDATRAENVAVSLSGELTTLETFVDTLNNKQPIDATLTALASLLTAEDKLIYATGPDAFAVTDLSSFARSILSGVNAAAVRTTISAQQLDATLTALAGVTTASDKLIYATGVDAFATTDFSVFGRSLVAAGTSALARSALSLDLFQQSGSNNGGFGTTAGPGVKFRFRGAIDWSSGSAYGLYVDPTLPDSAGTYVGVFSIPVMGTSPAQTSIIGFQSSLPAISSSAISSVYGFVATSSLGGVGSTINVGFRGSLPSGTGNWNLYMDGSAPNYFAGRTDCAGGVSVGGGSTISKILTATASLDFPSVAAASSQDLTITVTGAAVNDSVALGLPATPTAGIVFSAFVSAANTVKVRATNITASAIDPAAFTARVTVFSF